jgi:hypothetical protein
MYTLDPDQFNIGRGTGAGNKIDRGGQRFLLLQHLHGLGKAGLDGLRPDDD